MRRIATTPPVAPTLGQGWEAYVFPAPESLTPCGLLRYVASMRYQPSQSPFASTFLEESIAAIRAIAVDQVELLAEHLRALRERGGRLFVVGVGGGAAHASHAVGDFRKLCGIEAYAPVDNIAELTARTNDDGWETTFSEWLRISHLTDRDALMVFSVGGGSEVHGISPNIAEAVRFAREVGAEVLGVVGRRDGVATQLGQVVIVVKAPEDRLTPHVEGMQCVLLHLLVTHPLLATTEAPWEALSVNKGSHVGLDG